ACHGRRALSGVDGHVHGCRQNRPRLHAAGAEMKMLDRLRRDERGFSLAELLIVVAVLGMMLAGITFAQMQGQTSYLIGSRRVEAQQNGRVALELMARELRSAQSATAIPRSTDM